MIIIIDGKRALLKSNFSFEYFSENRLFLGRDGYTLSMVFPLRGCSENLSIFGHIHRMDVAKKNIVFDCSIVDSKVTISGQISVVKISESEVECQFAEGRCAQTVTDPFEDVLISDLELGSSPVTNKSQITPLSAWQSIDEGGEEVALPWINENYPTVPNNWVNYSANSYSWDEANGPLSWQPYLIVIAKRICDAIGYEYDFTEWEQSPYRHLIVCNTLPGSWYMPEYAKALPGWSVSEFFSNLELLLMCEFNFDYKGKSVVMTFSRSVLDNIEPVRIDEVVDSYNVEVSQEDNSSCNYIASKRVAYKQCSHPMQNFYACDWYVNKCTVVKRYDTLAELIAKNKRSNYIQNGEVTRVFWGDSMGEGWDSRLTTLRALLYAKDVDKYYVFRSIGTEKFNEARNLYTQIYVLQEVNVFGSGSVESDDVDTEEIEFVPVCIIDTYVDASDDKGYMMALNPSGYSESSTSDSSGSSEGTRPGGALDRIDPAEIQQPGPASTISNGEKNKSSDYYDEIYVAFWDGSMVEPGKTPYPVIDESIVSQDWKVYSKPGFSLRLFGHSGSNTVPLITQLPQIDNKQKFKFSWLANEIPNPRALFNIKGQRFLCEKITATFTEDGMSELMKGEFWPLAE